MGRFRAWENGLPVAFQKHGPKKNAAPLRVERAAPLPKKTHSSVPAVVRREKGTRTLNSGQGERETLIRLATRERERSKPYTR